MKHQRKTIFYWLLFSAVILALILIMQPLEVYFFLKDLPVLFPKGLIGLQERDLLLFIQVMMLVFVIPVYIFTFIFSWLYRADNDKSKYDPHLVDHKIAEVIWWGLPLIMTTIVAIVTWYKTHELDPYKPIESDNKTIKIEVVALQWNWLFIYPEEKIASLNYIRIPKDHPIHFFITADAPMNSFWLPRLGGQIYAMPGMRTELHLIANEEGSFRGASAQVSGEGFAGMTFITEATSNEDYQEWVKSVQQTGEDLDWAAYEKIAMPTLDHPENFFQLKDDTLFQQIIMKFMKPSSKG